MHWKRNGGEVPLEVVEQIEKAWGWAGIKPVEVIGDNDFGNLIIKDAAGSYWRLCPEDLYCNRVANDRAEFDILSQDYDFLRDWYMGPLA